MTKTFDPAQEAILELRALADLGIDTAAGIAYVEQNLDEIRNYYDEGASITEIADLARDLAAIAEPTYRLRIRAEAPDVAAEAVAFLDNLLDQNPNIAF